MRVSDREDAPPNTAGRKDNQTTTGDIRREAGCAGCGIFARSAGHGRRAEHRGSPASQGPAPRRIYKQLAALPLPEEPLSPHRRPLSSASGGRPPRRPRPGHTSGRSTSPSGAPRSVHPRRTRRRAAARTAARLPALRPRVGRRPPATPGDPSLCLRHRCATGTALTARPARRRAAADVTGRKRVWVSAGDVREGEHGRGQVGARTARRRLRGVWKGCQSRSVRKTRRTATVSRRPSSGPRSWEWTHASLGVDIATGVHGRC
jgi:hypothetical protein